MFLKLVSPENVVYKQYLFVNYRSNRTQNYTETCS
ncbi:hypothetical protein T01_13381 [Trichinella spiralis]|uniref:Uncharacterized protein n=1 Tax=Trichinella spiralis TaxID=6334 RepID=A0A0V1AHS6_TRISP|nr:hypothetical protein T01_13381 [Trichinella spiralis]